MKKKLWVGVLLATSILGTISLSGCGKKEAQNIKDKNITSTATDLQQASWNEIEQAAKGTTVTFYGWGGDDKINKWVDTVVAKEMKEKHDITVKRVGMDITEIITKLLTEKEANAQGTMDVIWINGENFYTAKTNGLLHGEFTSKLENMKHYIDEQTQSNKFDFGVATEGMEAPYGKAQFVFFGDKDSIGKFPTNPKELLEWAKNNPGKFTYPAPPEFTGSAFIRNIILQFVPQEELMNPELTKEQLAKKIQPAIDYLKELKPYLWRQGQTYPANFAQLSNMYADGELTLGMTYTADGVAKMVEQGSYSKGTQTFSFEKGGLSNTHYLTITPNAPNKAGAMVLINELLAPKLQASKQQPSQWGDLSVIDMKKLSAKEKELFKGTTSINYKTLAEPHAKLIPVIEEIWEAQLAK